MAEEFRHRPYRDGDAQAINGLYSAITGRNRSVAEFEWQWQHAPGGPADIWLIEACEGKRTRLIGHHGIMPVRFSLGADDLLLGKTENTMVLPEYRRKILYPRFEKRFAAQYEDRYDALFSTLGPPAAIRQRQALGYTADAKWLRVLIPTGIGGELQFALRRLSSRLSGHRPASRDGSGADFDTDSTRGPADINALGDNEARNASFFDRFWSASRHQFGLTPARSAADLDWRFWSNPHASFTTLIVGESTGEPGFAILRRHPDDARVAFIDDLVPSAPTPSKLSRLLRAILVWLRVRGVAWAHFSTTFEPGARPGPAATIALFEMRSRRLRDRLRPPRGVFMPRKITRRGEKHGVSAGGWYVTPIVFEGRN